MSVTRRVRVDSLAESVHRHLDKAIICVDVLLTTTTAVTAVARGRRTVIVGTPEEALAAARRLSEPVLALEAAPSPPAGFDGDAGPAALERRGDVARPLVLASPTARLLDNARGAQAVYLACLRNAAATAAYVAEHHERVAVIGAGFGHQTRCEDQIVANQLALDLVKRGFKPDGLGTEREIARWGGADMALARLGRGAELMCRIGRQQDVDFALARRDDLQEVCEFHNGEVVGRSWPAPHAVSAGPRVTWSRWAPLTWAPRGA